MKLPVSKQVFWSVTAFYVLLFLWLFNRHFAPLGSWRTARLISAPFPAERVEKTDGDYGIKETPVYFEARNPRKFDQAEMMVQFRGEAPIIEAGVVKSQDPWRVQTRTLYHKYLEELDWPRIDKDGLTLWQREPRYQSVEEFLNDPPKVEEMAVVDANSHIRERSLALLGMTDRGVRYDVSLRGPQNIYLAHSGGALEVRFLVQDMNRHDEPDSVAVKLFDQSGAERARAELPDDGEEFNSRKPSALRELKVEMQNLDPGVYRLILGASDDIFIRRIVSSTPKIVWKGQLYLSDEVQYGSPRGPLTVYSSGQGFALRTPHPESVQSVRFPQATIELVEHNKQYQIQIPRDIAGDLLSITTVKRDLVLNADGFFALSREAFFLPEPISYKSNLNLDRLGVNYVLARYKMTKEKRGWREGRVKVATFDISPPRPLQFFVGIPLGAEGDLEVGKVVVTLKKPPLTLAKIWSKLKSGL